MGCLEMVFAYNLDETLIFSDEALVMDRLGVLDCFNRLEHAKHFQEAKIYQNKDIELL